eukprot:GHUV01001518.1.p1 GENE.GHUV01001518.1~~GHUV01001518.1.p1  ORF type:complete len:104 (+),score=7.79 GHUV01001518.1:796-1107(+)
MFACGSTFCLHAGMLGWCVFTEPVLHVKGHNAVCCLSWGMDCPAVGVDVRTCEWGAAQRSATVLVCATPACNYVQDSSYNSSYKTALSKAFLSVQCYVHAANA